MFRGEFVEKAPAFVGTGGVFLNERKKFIADDTAGDFVFVEQTGDGFVEDVDIADDRRLDLRPLHEKFDFVKLSHVVAELRNYPLGAAMDFAGELEILRHQFTLLAFEWRNGAADEEFCLREFFGLAAGPLHFEAVVHRLEHGDEADRI